MASKKLVTILLVCVFLLLISGLVYYFVISQDSRIEQGGNNQAERADTEIVNLENCYLVQSDFKTYNTSITLDQLKDGEIYTNSENTSILNENGFTNLNVIDHEQDVYVELGDMEKSEFYVAEPGLVDYRYYTLKIDGVNFWEKENLEKYPLCFSKKLEVKIDEKEEVLSKYFLVDETYYNFDLDGINSIFMGGEIIPARAVDRTWLNPSDNYTLLFDRLREKIQGSDLAIAMLENPLKGDPEPCKGCMIFVGDERNAQGFKDVGFDAFGVGNHFGDGGQSAIQRTIELMDELDIGLAGASNSTLEAASDPYIMEMGNYKVALLSAEDVAAYYWFGQSFGTNYYSKKGAGGGVGVIDEQKITNDIAKAKEQADIVLVMMSWGTEYTNHSNAHQQELAHAIIDAGADMIVGSHPHWVQEIEVYKGKPIVYSLGNFIFDQTDEGPSVHSSRHYGETRQGMTMVAHYYQGELKNMEMIPHVMCGYNQVGGESYNKTRNLAWKIQDKTMTYKEADQIPESQGCIWYQPTPILENHKFYKPLWDRMMEFTNL